MSNAFEITDVGNREVTGRYLIFYHRDALEDTARIAGDTAGINMLNNAGDAEYVTASAAKSKVDTLSWVIHLFGDVHQPLHCIDHISDLHPSGDKGGNGFRLKGKAKNLHSAWDSSVNVTNVGVGNEELAETIMAEHTRESLAHELQVTDTEKWARASFQLAKKNAYSITENPAAPPKLSAAYLKKMEQIGHRQAALAGYRLADRLKQILD